MGKFLTINTAEPSIQTIDLGPIPESSYSSAAFGPATSESTTNFYQHTNHSVNDREWAPRISGSLPRKRHSSYRCTYCATCFFHRSSFSKHITHDSAPVSLQSSMVVISSSDTGHVSSSANFVSVTFGHHNRHGFWVQITCPFHLRCLLLPGANLYTTPSWTVLRH